MSLSQGPFYCVLLLLLFLFLFFYWVSCVCVLFYSHRIVGVETSEDPTHNECLMYNMIRRASISLDRQVREAPPPTWRDKRVRTRIRFLLRIPIRLREI